ncbi:MAG: glycosyltransferase [Magnetococcus sp. DMHC-6]
MANLKSKRVLLIAFHFPPARGASGLQRTLKFARDLPTFGWEPLLLTAHPRAHLLTGAEQMADIPSSMPIHRAFALDAARHLAIAGRFPRLLALPDRWSSWWLGAIPTGLRMIQRYRPQVIWSTHPIATAHLIGLTLHRLTALPWIADFRDPMVTPVYPEDQRVRKVYRWLEQRALTSCTKAVVVTPGMADLYHSRYPQLPQHHLTVITNGYDENDFSSVHAETNKPKKKFLELLHSGHLYPNPAHRDPTAFLQALGHLKQLGIVAATHGPTAIGLLVRLRASGDERRLAQIIAENQLNDMVFLENYLPFKEALQEMINADGLLLFQGPDLSTQIPGKLFEYFRVQKPILALTGPGGDTDRLLRQVGITPVAGVADQENIVRNLPGFLTAIRQGTAPVVQACTIERFSRQARAQELAQLFDQVMGEQP